MGTIKKPIFWEWLIFYPEIDETNYDGVHDGGVMGIQKDAPKEAKEEFKKYMKEIRSGKKL